MKAIKIGDKINMLTVDGEAERYKWGQKRWTCLCDCGTVILVREDYLKSGRNKSCGCYNLAKSIKHGMSNTRFYKVWENMKNRCNSKKHKAYHRYGERGIKVCKRWDNFLFFKNDMYKSYLENIKIHGEKQTTIDRIDNNSNYSPENCRWATRSEQGYNTSNTLSVIIDGVKGDTSFWSKKYGVSPNVIRDRMYKKRVGRSKLTLKQIVSSPIGKRPATPSAKKLSTTSPNGVTK